MKLERIEDLDVWVAQTVQDVNRHNSNHTTSAALYMMFYAGMQFQLEQQLANEQADLSKMLDDMAKRYDK